MSGMSAAQLVAEFRALQPGEREEVLRLLLADPELREDLQDSLTIEERRHEPSRPLNDVLADLE